jgi:3-oxoacyl-[acyl-carrier protein] reductase
MEQGKLKGKTAIVTGSASGIGAAVALGLAKRGADVVVNYSKNEKDAKAIASQIAASGGRALCIQGDVGKDEDCRKLADAAMSAWGRIDILVNNAGIYPHLPFDQLDYADWRRVLELNLDAAFLCSHAVYPTLKERGYGRIVNISSAAVHVGPPGMAHYLASKAGLIGLTRSLAVEAGAHGITVNAITPGFVETPGVLADPAEIELFDVIVAEQAVPRRGQPEDIAECVAYLVRPAAGFITGQTLNVDGGHRFL